MMQCTVHTAQCVPPHSTALNGAHMVHLHHTWYTCTCYTHTNMVLHLTPPHRAVWCTALNTSLHHKVENSIENSTHQSMYIAQYSYNALHHKVYNSLKISYNSTALHNARLCSTLCCTLIAVLYIPPKSVVHPPLIRVSSAVEASHRDWQSLQWHTFLKWFQSIHLFLRKKNWTVPLILQFNLYIYQLAIPAVAQLFPVTLYSGQFHLTAFSKMVPSQSFQLSYEASKNQL